MDRGASYDVEHQLGHAGGDFGGRAHLVHQQRLGERGEDCHARVERSVRILENHLHVPPGPADVRGRAGGEIPTLEYRHRWSWAQVA